MIPQEHDFALPAFSELLAWSFALEQHDSKSALFGECIPHSALHLPVMQAIALKSVPDMPRRTAAESNNLPITMSRRSLRIHCIITQIQRRSSQVV